MTTAGFDAMNVANNFGAPAARVAADGAIGL
jgi:hypothetical protein